MKSGLQSLQRLCKSSPVIFVSDSVDGSVDSGMSDIMVESDYCVNFSRKWYLQVFDTAVFLAEALNRMTDNFKTILKDIRLGQTFISLLS